MQGVMCPDIMPLDNILNFIFKCSASHMQSCETGDELGENRRVFVAIDCLLLKRMYFKTESWFFSLKTM